MKRIIFNNFERQWIAWGALCLLCFIAGLLAAFAEDNHIWMILFMPVGLMSYLAQFERNPGSLRVVLVLPFTTRQIGRMFWWLRVGFPTLFLAFFGGLGILIHDSFSNAQAGVLTVWLGMVLVGGLLFGSIFWLLSGSPSPSRSPYAWQNRLWGHFYSYGFSIALIGGGYLLYKSAISLEMKFAILCFFGLIFSLLGWFRAENLVIDYGTYRQEIADSGKTIGIFKPRLGYGGIRFLMMTFCLRFLGIAALLTVILIGFPIWDTHQLNWPKVIKAASDSIQTQPLTFVFVIFCFQQIISIGPHLKFLRSLPLTSKQLAMTILFLAFMPFFIIGTICVSLVSAGNDLPAGLSFIKSFALTVSPICVLTTAAIWYKENRAERIVLAVIALIVSMIPLTCQLMDVVFNPASQGLPVWFIIIFSLATFFLALLTISRLLERNDMTYRIRQEMLDGWQ